MLREIKKTVLVPITLMLLVVPLHAQEKQPKGMPPAKVVVSEVKSGMIATEAEFVGTVYYTEVSDVASEVSGVVEWVFFEEGQRVKYGDFLVTLGSEMLEKSIEATTASYEQALADLEKAIKDFQRIENLYSEDSIAEQVFDEYRFRVKGLDKKAQSLKAEVERLEVELNKKAVLSPFDGVVIKRHSVTGEWLSPGSPVATIAKDEEVEVVVDIPEAIIRYIKKEMVVRVKTGGKEIKGKVFVIVPRGDISTRTFPVKIRVKNDLSLIEGLEASVKLPTGEKRKALIVPRDAVITMFGKTVLFAVIDSKAVMIPVKVVGYEEMTAGVDADRLREGMQVVVKGNERLRDGQRVIFK